MNKLEALNRYFVEQKYPYGEPSAWFFRLVTGVTEGKDGQPVRVLGDDLYPYNEAVKLSGTFGRYNVEPFKIQDAR